MLYREFKRSSVKHLKTCECILEVLDNKECISDKKHLESNLFYLSGYIIETILKYMLFVSINYDRNSDIKDLDNDGLTYQNSIKTHSLQELYQKLQTKYSISTNITRNELNKWNVHLRYKEYHLEDLSFIKSFFTKAKLLYDELYRY